MRGRMRLLYVLLSAILTFADSNHNRRTKLPYVVDAVGNSLPPPSRVPATVGSPVNLLNPDRYEFFTFDESGELVKRLMTLQEIQAIVAAGEEADGLVTIANDAPTMSFNYTQPSLTKVHSVVTNVKNVLKSQMESHKPIVQTTFDTPDVSDTWSLILPSIFGNTGADIVPDKISGAFITPETETIEIDNLSAGFGTSESKESNEIPIQPSNINGNINKTPNHISTTISSPTTSTTTSTTTFTPIFEKLMATSEVIPILTRRPLQTTVKPEYSTSKAILISTSSTTFLPVIPSKNVTNHTNETTNIFTTQKLSSESDNKQNTNLNNSSNKIYTNKPIEYEKISTFSPISTVAYITEKSKIPESNVFTNSVTTDVNKIMSSTSSTSLNQDYKETNSTTITTQSVLPSTSIPSTALDYKEEDNSNNDESKTTAPVFDVAQSISQIASDLGNNFAPVPTSNALVDSTKINNVDIESKENIEIDIPTESTIEYKNMTNKTDDPDNFIKISTFDPHDISSLETVSANSEDPVFDPDFDKKDPTTLPPLTTHTPLTTTSKGIIDPILSVSLDDLLSQVVHENPTSVVYNENVTNLEAEVTTELKKKYESFDQETTTFNVIKNMPTEADTITHINVDEDQPNTLNISFNNTPVNNKTNKDTPVSTISSLKYKSDYELLRIRDNENGSVNVNSITNKTYPNLLYSQEKKRIVDTTSSPSYKTSALEEVIISTPMPVKTFTTTPLEYNNNIEQKFKIKLEDQLQNIPIKYDEFKKKIQKVNIDEKELINQRNNSWKLIPTVHPPNTNEAFKDKHKIEGFYIPEHNDKDIILEFPKENQGLDVTTNNLGEDILQFTELCNELAFRYWQLLTENIDKKRSIVFSPYSITSALAMMFMGAKGETSEEMNNILKLDDMVTFNPHFTLKNISDSIETTSASGVAVSAFIRELFSERHKNKILTFYKERAQHFYNGHVEEINFDLISDIIRRRTNLLVKRFTWGKIVEYIKSNSITMDPPLASFSANIFQTDCTGTSIEGRNGEIYFVVSPNVRQRRLVPVPAVVYKTNFLAGYDPNLDATAAALGNTNSIISTLFLMPGQQGNAVHADDLEILEKRLLSSSQNTFLWKGLLRTLLPRLGLELQIPRFSHKSVLNVSSTLKKMGLKELFDADNANLGGINGPSKDLYLSDMVQMTTFATCGEGVISEQHHIEEYPDLSDLSIKQRSSKWLTRWDEPRDYQRAFHDPHDVGDAMHLPLHLRPRQARLPARNSQPARLKFDRPFLFFVRHNPSGMILYVGRYNPRLLP